MKTKYLLMAAYALSCMMFTACGDDDDSKLPIDQCKYCDCGHKEGECPETCDCRKKITIAKVDIPVDNSFVPNQSYIQGEWAGEYKGWDAQQKYNTTIRRRLTLNPNGTYTNKIAGQLINSGKEGFYPFESEGGKYTYNQSTGIITYTCEYDSVLVYDNQSYKRYAYKHEFEDDPTHIEYTEQVKFSVSQKGQRVWITKDTYLQSLTAEILDLVFSMSKYDGEKTGDENK